MSNEVRIGGSLCVATVTYESGHVIGGWLENVRQFLPDAEIIVVDNDSKDSSARIAEESAARARVIHGGANLGFGRGCNLAAENTGREFVWFLNPDARVRDLNWASLTHRLDTVPFGLVETAMRADAGDLEYDVFEGRSVREEWITHVLTPLWPRALGTAPGHLRHGHDWASGASLLVRKSEFTAVGGFDPSFFLLYEDRELSWRASRAGLPIGTTDAIVTAHEPGGSSTESGLAVARRAWAMLSWIEFVCASFGQERGTAVARALIGSLSRIGRVGVRLNASTRLGRKTRSYHDVLCMVGSTLAERVNDGYYVRAAEAIRRAEGEHDD